MQKFIKISDMIRKPNEKKIKWKFSAEAVG